MNTRHTYVPVPNIGSTLTPRVPAYTHERNGMGNEDNVYEDTRYGHTSTFVFASQWWSILVGHFCRPYRFQFKTPSLHKIFSFVTLQENGTLQYEPETKSEIFAFSTENQFKSPEYYHLSDDCIHYTTITDPHTIRNQFSSLLKRPTSLFQILSPEAHQS